MNMNKKTLNKLEYNKIIEMLTDHASSFNGRELCRKLKPMVSLSDINAAQQQLHASLKREGYLLADAIRSTTL